MYNSYKLLITVLALVFVFSCDNEPLEGFDLNNPTATNTNPNITTSVIGTWRLTAWNAENPVDINNDGTASVNLLDELNCYDNETVVFAADNTGVAMSTSYADVEVELVAGTTNEYTFTSTCISEIENTNITWTQTGNTVAVTDVTVGITNDLTITGNELSFVLPEGFFASNSTGTLEVTEDLTLVYTRQ